MIVHDAKVLFRLVMLRPQFEFPMRLITYARVQETQRAVEILSIRAR